jgi:hypothetical protein
MKRDIFQNVTDDVHNMHFLGDFRIGRLLDEVTSIVEEEFLDLSNGLGRVGECIDNLFVILGTLNEILSSKEEAG